MALSHAKLSMTLEVLLPGPSHQNGSNPCLAEVNLIHLRPYRILSRLLVPSHMFPPTRSAFSLRLVSSLRFPLQAFNLISPSGMLAFSRVIELVLMVKARILERPLPTGPWRCGIGSYSHYRNPPVALPRQRWSRPFLETLGGH